MDMDNMIDMKMPKKSKKETMGEKMPATSNANEPEYPYGLQLSLNTDSLKKFKELSDCEVGAEVHVTAMAVITSLGKEQMRDGKESNHMELQITKMSATPEDNYENSFDKAVKEK